MPGAGAGYTEVRSLLLPRTSFLGSLCHPEVVTGALTPSAGHLLTSPCVEVKEETLSCCPHWLHGRWQTRSTGVSPWGLWPSPSFHTYRRWDAESPGHHSGAYSSSMTAERGPPRLLPHRATLCLLYMLTLPPPSTLSPCRPSLEVNWALGLPKWLNFRAEAGKTGEGQTENWSWGKYATLSHFLWMWAEFTWDPSRKVSVAYFAARVWGYPCPWSPCQANSTGVQAWRRVSTGLHQFSQSRCAGRPGRPAQVLRRPAPPPTASPSILQLGGFHLLEIQIHTLLTWVKDLLPPMECILAGREWWKELLILWFLTRDLLFNPN